MAKLLDLDFRTGSYIGRVPQAPLIRAVGINLVTSLKQTSVGNGLYISSYNAADNLVFFLSKKIVNSPTMSMIYWLYIDKSSQSFVISTDLNNYALQIYPNGVCYFNFGATNTLFHSLTVPLRKYVQIALTFNGNAISTKREMSYVNGIFKSYYTNAVYNTVGYGSGGMFGGNSPNIRQYTLFRHQIFDTVLTQKQINQDYQNFLNSRPEQINTKF